MDFERFWVEIEEAFRQRNKFAAIKIIRMLVFELSGLRDAKNYVDHYFDRSPEAMRDDLMKRLGISSTTVKESGQAPIRIVQDGPLRLTVTGEVTFDQMNQFFSKIMHDLNLE